ncbi:MAG TPA: sugar transferase [Ktedonosporobacter sp.]|nr:sugar transferase [Ktedonosporobacter sp.]
MHSTTHLDSSSIEKTVPNLFIGPQITRTEQIAKRFLDIFGALFGLTLLAMALPIIAVLIFWEDRGPIFYHQMRVGQYGHPFRAYKLRSMRVDADDWLTKHPELQQVWLQTGKLRNDPRITRIGHFLRRTSLDELPQMLNVLYGEMSLVGPRAILFSQMDVFGELFELRHLVRPGLTGLWQISGRAMLSHEQRCALDCMYVMERSFWVDLLIIVKTIPAITRGIGAY